MKIDILTLFPDFFSPFLEQSILKRAIDKQLVTINIHNIRDYSTDPHHKVDDTPYGGGDGMVLMCQPIFDAIKQLRTNNSKVIMLSPQGTTYCQTKAYDLAKTSHLILLCGHYEGFDERIRTICDEEISIGDYVLTGGEIPSMVIVDSVVRLIDGVIKEGSHQNDSFNHGLLDYPNYTKPREYEGLKVPDILLSGHHEKIEQYRLTEAIKKTKNRRPEIMVGDNYDKE